MSPSRDRLQCPPGSCHSPSVGYQYLLGIVPRGAIGCWLDSKSETRLATNPTQRQVVGSEFVF